jgi:hypothetical protein
VGEAPVTQGLGLRGELSLRGAPVWPQDPRPAPGEVVYRVREGPGEDLTPRYPKAWDELRTRCERRQEAAQEKAQALAVEFLNDWEAIFGVLTPRPRPLMNNPAEQGLPHEAIGRRISHGTRPPLAAEPSCGWPA